MGQSKRRQFLSVFGALAVAPRFSLAQQSGRTYRLGWLSSSALRSEAYNVAFVQRLRELGFVEGRNLTIEFHSAEGRSERLPGLAANLARQKCDIYFSPGSEAILVALKQATGDAPIVIAALDFDPVASGHIASFARPGGRMTGVYTHQEDLAVKRLEVLKEVLPGAKRIAVIADASSLRQLVAVRGAATKLGVELLVHEFQRAPYDYEAAFAEFARGKADGLLALGSAFFAATRQKIPSLALQHRLPGIYNNVFWVEDGGLLSYGADFLGMYRRLAELVSMVLRGAKPAELPVEQSSVFELAVNLKTAKALSIKIPQLVLTRADRVIE